MIVVDTNVVAALSFGGRHSLDAEALLAAEPCWSAPPLLLPELRSVAAKSMAAGKMDLAGCIAVLENAIRRTRISREQLVDHGGVLELAAGSACSTYDCEFVWLAKWLGVPLATWDRSVLSSFPNVAVEPGRLVERLA